MNDNEAPFGAVLFAVVVIFCGAVLLYGAACAAWDGLQQVMR